MKYLVTLSVFLLCSASFAFTNNQAALKLTRNVFANDKVNNIILKLGGNRKLNSINTNEISAFEVDGVERLMGTLSVNFSQGWTAEEAKCAVKINGTVWPDGSLHIKFIDSTCGSVSEVDNSDSIIISKDQVK